MTFGEVIKKRRQELGLTQSELGRKTWLTQCAISHLEIDMTQPRPVTQLALCRALDLNPDTLEPLPTPRPTTVHWVPVEQWVKVDNKDVLALTITGYRRIVVWSDHWNDWLLPGANVLTAVREITHIAPLPEGPR